MLQVTVFFGLLMILFGAGMQRSFGFASSERRRAEAREEWHLRHTEQAQRLRDHSDRGSMMRHYFGGYT